MPMIATALQWSMKVVMETSHSNYAWNSLSQEELVTPHVSIQSGREKVKRIERNYLNSECIFHRISHRIIIG